MVQHHTVPLPASAWVVKRVTIAWQQRTSAALCRRSRKLSLRSISAHTLNNNIYPCRAALAVALRGLLAELLSRPPPSRRQQR